MYIRKTDSHEGTSRRKQGAKKRRSVWWPLGFFSSVRFPTSPSSISETENTFPPGATQGVTRRLETVRNPSPRFRSKTMINIGCFVFRPINAGKPECGSEGLEIRCSIRLSYAPLSAQFILSAVGVIPNPGSYTPRRSRTRKISKDRQDVQPEN